jgi:hypothetical protein
MAVVTAQQEAALTAAHLEAQARLRQRVATAAVAAWQNLRSYDEEDVAPWLAIIVPLIYVGQRTAVSLVDAFVASVLGRRPIGLDSERVVSRVRPGVSPETQWRRPFVTVWSDLQNQQTWEHAVSAAGSRIDAMAQMDMQLAHIGAYQAAQDADPTTIQGFRRKADPGACKFCRLVDGAYVKRADASPLHDRCGCGLVPRIEPAHPTPLPAGVAVHEHGELGPTLADPAHDFTTHADLAA